MNLLLILVYLLLMPSNPCQGVPEVTFRHFNGDWNSLVDGYCMGDPSGRQWFINGLPEYDWYMSQQSPQHFTTRALWQAEGVIQETAAIRNISLDGVHGVSLLFPADLGRSGYVRVPGGFWYPIRSADAAALEHIEYHAEIVQSGIELGYELAVILEAPGGGLWDLEVCLTEGNPDEACPGIPINFEEWYRGVKRYE